MGSHRCLLPNLPPCGLSRPDINVTPEKKTKMRGEIINNAGDLIKIEKQKKQKKKEKMTSHARLLLLFVVRLYESMVSRRKQSHHLLYATPTTV